MDDILKEAKLLQPSLIHWRRTIHQNAETGIDLPGTAAFVESVLKENGIPCHRMAGYGIVACIGRGEKTILLRADMDALPGTERSGLPFACTSGAVHACGHDIHTAMLLGAAKLLHAQEDKLSCRVVLMFQPGEEVMLGAKQMVEAGLLEKYKPDCAFAMHVNVEDVPAGHVWIKESAFMAASDIFEVVVNGKRGHGAHPQNAVNPIYAALKIIEAFTDITRFEISPLKPNIITICAVKAGEAANVIPDQCVFRGSLRTLDTEVRDKLLSRMECVTEEIAAAYRCKGKFSLTASTPCSVNDAAVSSWAADRLVELLGAERVCVVSMPSMGSEDFSQVSSRVPSCYMSIGISRANGCTVPLHNEQIVFDESNMYLGSAVFTALARSYALDTDTTVDVI